jgi:iron complex outermembrane receptor protein
LVGIQEIALAQGKISGNIVNNGKPIEFATVTLSNTQDSTKVLFYEASDSLGQFSFNNLSLGKYKLGVKLVGYQALSRNITLNIDNKEYQIKDLNLVEDKISLSNVIVVAQKK